MTEQRQHLTTEDFAERTPLDRDSLDGRGAEREPIDQTPADRDVAEPDLTDQERLDREPVAHDSTGHDSTGHDHVGQDHVGEDHAGHDPAGHDSTGHWTSTLEEPVAFDEQDTREQPAEHDEPVEPAAVDTTAGDAPLFTPDDAADYQAEWRALQADFVDDPREAVQRADELVAQVMQSLATTFTEHKHSLEEQWQRGDEAQTEELRQALKRYRTFFDRLLSV
ncbi:hypothetical protein [Saccharothrix texasensis]|uniref:Uncharacterized protein n=1 Tax=Saccharothrix texasensis TaxID=103734 RepID=A0A3N1H4V8_9PSEU|nr:hypothetical protein [Saccharothrix texasensis]ROP37570.1 hypothetical protein EDD40_2889 [Saccharothrix texasensis]